jgi:hypothetical protein
MPTGNSKNPKANILSGTYLGLKYWSFGHVKGVVYS